MCIRLYERIPKWKQERPNELSFQGCRSNKSVLWIFNCCAEIYLVIMETIWSQAICNMWNLLDLMQFQVQFNLLLKRWINWTFGLRWSSLRGTSSHFIHSDRKNSLLYSFICLFMDPYFGVYSHYFLLFVQSLPHVHCFCSSIKPLATHPGKSINLVVSFLLCPHFKKTNKHNQQQHRFDAATPIFFLTRKVRWWRWLMANWHV